MFKVFKAFMMTGKTVGLAVAEIVGAVFGKSVSSLVNNSIMPPIGRLLGSVDAGNFYINMSRTPCPGLKAALVVSAAPTTEECPPCYSTLASEAKRCPNGASQLQKGGSWITVIPQASGQWLGRKKQEM